MTMETPQAQDVEEAHLRFTRRPWIDDEGDQMPSSLDGVLFLCPFNGIAYMLLVTERQR